VRGGDRYVVTYGIDDGVAEDNLSFKLLNEEKRQFGRWGFRLQVKRNVGDAYLPVGGVAGNGCGGGQRAGG